MARPSRPRALVTGASRGIGQAIALALAPGCDLVLTARDTQTLHETRERATAAGAEIELVAADLVRADARAGLVAHLVTHAGGSTPISVLVNNAGVAPSARLDRTSDTQWHETLAVNATAPFELARALVPGMVAQGWGRIVNIASTAALKGYRYTCAYAASKGALVAMTRAIAAEVAGRGITVNAICPGFTDTDMAADAVANITAATGRDAAQARASLERFNPQQRLVAPDEVAALCAFLISDAAASIHGQALAIEGGETTL